MKLTSEDCRKCGVCCVSLTEHPEYADVTEKDKARLGQRFVRLNVLQDAIKTEWKTQRTGPFKGVQACSCVALRGSLMSRVSCSVYKVRPEVCKKAVKPGDRTCLRVRQMFRDLIERESEE
jgi:Fe-S-cluster containining protein